MSDTLRSLGIVTGSVSRRAGGLFNSVRHSALALSEAGLDVDVLGLRDGFTEEDIAAWAPLVPRVSKSLGPSAIGLAPDLGAQFRHAPYDVVHQHGIWQAFSMQVSKWHRQTGRPYMISPRGMLDEWAIRNSAWKKKLTGALYEYRHLRGAACLHALNPSEADSIRAAGYTQPIAIIPNGADLPDDRPTAQPDWWPDNDVLLFIGRIHPKKGIMELLQAWSALTMRQAGIAERWTLAIAGWDDGGHEAEIRAFVETQELADRVILPGSLFGEDKRAALQHASAFILPSYSEGLPMSVLEAWSYGLPVLMTDACNIPEGFSAGAAMRISTDPAALESELEAALVRDHGSLTEMGVRGRDLVDRQFGWSSIAERHLDVYRWMIDGCPPGDRPSCVV